MISEETRKIYGLEQMIYGLELAQLPDSEVSRDGWSMQFGHHQ